MRHPPLPRRAVRGFSLLEAVIALFLFSIALLLAAGLLRQGAMVAAGSARELDDFPAAFAPGHLRADLQRATAAGGSGPVAAGGWSRRALLLTGPGRSIRYEKVANELHRVDLGAAAATNRRTVMTRVISFRWRRLAPGLVEVELTYLRPAELSALELGGRPDPSLPPLREELFLRQALRGAIQERRW